MAKYYIEKSANEEEASKAENVEAVETKTEEVSKPKKNLTSFRMIKNSRGTISVALEPYDFSAPSRNIVIKYDQEMQHVPVKWALGVFVTPSSLRMMENGYFTFDNLETLIEMAEDKGLYVPDSIKEPKVTSKELKQMLIKNDLKSLKQAMFNANKNRISTLVSIARSVIGKLNYETIKYIEETYGIELQTVDING